MGSHITKSKVSLEGAKKEVSSSGGNKLWLGFLITNSERFTWPHHIQRHKRPIWQSKWDTEPVTAVCLICNSLLCNSTHTSTVAQFLLLLLKQPQKLSLLHKSYKLQLNHPQLQQLHRHPLLKTPPIQLDLIHCTVTFNHPLVSQMTPLLQLIQLKFPFLCPLLQRLHTPNNHPTSQSSPKQQEQQKLLIAPDQSAGQYHMRMLEAEAEVRAPLLKVKVVEQKHLLHQKSVITWDLQRELKLHPHYLRQ